MSTLYDKVKRKVLKGNTNLLCAIFSYGLIESCLFSILVTKNLDAR